MSIDDDRSVQVLMICDGEIEVEWLSISRDWLQSLSRPAARPTRPQVNCVRSGLAAADLSLVQRADQIWLFGYQAGESSEALTKAIAARMNAGCGVFATGDHDDRGQQLCGSLPRVRHLRCWVRPANAPDYGDDSIDTVFPLLDSADVAAPRQPAENDAHFKPVFADRTGTATHPLMRLGEHGTIAWLPDHPHEGALGTLDVPALEDFTAAERAGIATLAWAMAWRKPGDGSPRHSPRAVPILRAYDPPADSAHGRIVVDSTFHHWVNYNLHAAQARPAGHLCEPFGHWQAYAANIYEYLLPARLRGPS